MDEVAIEGSEDIAERLGALFAQGRRIVFWEDPEAVHAEVAAALAQPGAMPGAELLDVTGCELAAKRRVLRQEPDARFVLYRRGATPRPEEDFLYDVKLAAASFSCSRESLWAASCGIDPELADALAGHGAFFASKERVQRLGASGLPKGTEAEILFAMTAACAGAGGATRLDAARDLFCRLLVQHARGTGRALADIRAAGLEGVLWQAAREELGYEPPAGEEPTLDDLALRMVLATCGPLIPAGEEAAGAATSDAAAGPAAPTLAASAERVLSTMAANPRTREAYRSLVEGVAPAIVPRIPAAARTPEAIGSADALPQFDRWILRELAARATQGSLTAEEADRVVDARKHGFWYSEHAARYELLQAVAHFDRELRAFDETLPAAASAQELFQGYCGGWYAVDAAYRHVTAAWHAVPSGSFKQGLAELRARIGARYEEFLEQLADRWQGHLLDAGAYPPADIYSQTEFYEREVVVASPQGAPGRPVAVIVSDALRYEVGAELAQHLAASRRRPLAGKVAVDCVGALSVLPSYTQAGMAALLPPGPLTLRSDELVEKGGASTAGLEARGAILCAAVPGALALRAADVLTGGEGGLPSLEGVPLVYVYHDAIDARGDSAKSEGEVFEACTKAMDEIEQLVAELMRAGACRVVVTADHGFIYQDEQELPEHLFAEVPDLHAFTQATDTKRSRRYLVGDVLPKNELLLEFDSSQLSYAEGPKVALPRGICRLRQQGSGARYVHGGATLQECAIPVVSVRRAQGAEAAHATGVQVFVTGRAVITGSTVALTLYQTEPVGAGVLPLTVKVGLYAPAGTGGAGAGAGAGAKAAGKLLSAAERTVELGSAAAGSEERKVRVVLPLINDVDEYQSAVLRVSARYGATNQYRSVWEQTYRVSRGFGSDF